MPHVDHGLTSWVQCKGVKSAPTVVIAQIQRGCKSLQSQSRNTELSLAYKPVWIRVHRCYTLLEASISHEISWLGSS